ncbi:MAG: Rho termination factor N-terminal domain-containing protein, partial [Actinomycetota bacterium]|nr:Rho termination factor N-terminal domain-containing protein [Actinomycetota bacterium]
MVEQKELNREFLNSKVISDLRAIAKQLNIQGVSKLKKDELIERIMEEVPTDGMGSSNFTSEGITIIKKDTAEKKAAEKEVAGKEITEKEMGAPIKEEKEPEIEKIEEEEELVEEEGKEVVKGREFELYKERMKGILDILADGYGFLRTSGYLAGPNDIYVSQSQIRRFRLRQGDEVYGQVRPPKEGEKYNALLRIEKVNDEDPEFIRTRVPFE